MPRSLRTKIITGFAVVVLLVTFVSAWTVMNIVDINDRATAIIDGDFRNVAIANRVRTALARYNFSMLRYVSFHTDSLRGQIAIHQEEFHHWMEEWRRSVTDISEQADLDSIAMEFRNLNAVGTALIEETVTRREGGSTFYAANYLPVYERIVDRLNWQREQNHDRSVERITSVGASARFIALSTVIIAAAVLILSIIASQKVLQIVLRPIRELTLSARRIAEGDFRHEITVGSSDDELSGLIHHFNVMIRQLREYDALKASQIVAEQRRCETIVRDLTDVVVATDEDRRVIYFNREAEHVIGLSAASVIGRPLEDLTAHGPMMRRMLDDLNAGPIDGAERLVTLRVGERERSYNYEAQTIGGDAGKIIGYMFRLKDITRFKQLDEIKTKMVSTVSHELRTPLTSMGMSLELMMEEDMRDHLDPVQLELLGNMQEDVKRLQMFVNDLLDLSRIESGRMHLDIRPVAPRALADAAARQVMALAVRQ